MAQRRVPTAAPVRRPLVLAAAGLAAAALTVALPATPAGAAGPEQVVNGTFDDGLTGWNAYPTAAVVDGRGCVDVPAGTGAYGAAIEQKIPMVEGETYAFSATILSEPATAANIRIVIQGGPDINYAEFLTARKVPLTPEPRAVTATFTADRDYAQANLTFQQDITNDAAYRFCVDDVSVTGGAEPEVYRPDIHSAVRVNQVGYLPDGTKEATIVTDATEPQRWLLRNADGTVVRRGTTRPEGVEDSAGVAVHVADFSAYRTPGRGYTLSVGDQTSFPFDIASDLYAGLRTDSKTFYYTNRSGIAIDDALAPGYGRRAGHVGVAPNRGDTAVPCLPLGDDKQRLYATPWTCSGTHDVTGGWYDAGDMGKYVVNGGISVAQLMQEFERTRTGAADPAAYADGTLSIPEAGNGVPDLLDEVRWELDWMLRMQVPAGEQYAGMAYHKVADADWTGLPLLPADDPQPRVLHRPSTAATLNLAAAAAQGARLFRPYDAAFADRLLAAARSSYAAAERTPDLLEPAADPALDPNPGSGPYEDDDVSDEFYWAAAELYLTTGDARYRTAVLASPHHTSRDLADGFWWQDVAGMGRLDLATVDSRLPGRKAVQRSVLRAADSLLRTERDEPFGQPYDPADGDWVWGSNSAVLNNLQVVGTAYDLSGKRRYADGVASGMDYLLGRNALDRSYVTGYGDVSSHQQHSRWYAHSLDPRLPSPPDGTVAGGPNSTATSTGDPVAAANLAGCVDQFCYIDEIGSWSTNEITVNWNAPLSWVSGFLAGYEGTGPGRS
ncbi:glycoside hydrolase family 9 protein [Phycicoccus flavus]|uniref:Endoglucanase n=1 Tax=Phycicoccus flavus TaxID=2502783 RepID=A0A8T6R5D7_9MICO|nr:glycoside hydrolase family 9 protein [Phycicoccus flavus]NHA68803.1 glycosyl hydrolase family 5 [Phycicoccus flavus]